MNHDPNDIKNGELDEARLTAYALEELEGAERAAVEALLAGSDRSRHTVEEIRALAAQLKQSARDPFPSRSSELRAVLEQYLSSEEATEMNAKPEPSSAKTRGRGWSRSRLIWAAAVCALVAVIPAYVLISGSLGPELQLVAVDSEPAQSPTVVEAGEMVAHARLEDVDADDASMVGYSAGVPIEEAASAAEFKGESSGLASMGRAQRSNSDGPVVVRGKELQAGRSRGVEATLPKSPSVVKRAQSRGMPAVAGEVQREVSEKSATNGMQEPGVFSADLDVPSSKDNYGAQVPQAGGMGGRTAGADAKGVDPKLNKSPYPTGKPPMFQAGGEVPVQTDGGIGDTAGDELKMMVTPGIVVQEEGEKGGMMGGMGMGGAGRTDDMTDSPETGLSDSILFERAPAANESKYAPSKGKAPAPADGEERYSFGFEFRGRSSSSGAKPEPTAQPSAGSQYGAVEVQTLPDLDVIILRGKARDEWRRSEEIEPEGRRPEMFGAGRQYNRRAPGTEQYEPIVENAFLSAADDPESTFSVDVDTASYANVRRFLTSGRLPPPNAVRIEELVNYFRYDYPQPDGEVPFSVNMETAECPWNTEHRLVRIGLKGREIDPEQRGPSNLVFLLDVSGSMRDENKLPLVQYAMNRLVDQLTEDDRVAIVTYAGEAGVALKSTSGEKQKKIRKAIDNLSAGGSTHGSAGIMMAYDQAMEHFVEEGTNRVILCADGDLNVGITDDNELVKLITQQAKSGVFLTVLGFGTGNLKDAKMEKLADKGNGIYAYVDGRREARRVLVEQVAGSLVTIAKDVKVQLEFNPAEVKSYRLIGYENRLMPPKDFDDDSKDAGEIGAGHTVTALYEIVPGNSESGGQLGRELRYQRKTGTELTEAAASGELFILYLRYKEPEGEKSTELTFFQKDSDKRFGKASADFRFAASVAGFGMLLRGSQYAGDLDWSTAEELASGSLGDDPGGYRNEFLELLDRARQLRSR